MKLAGPAVLKEPMKYDILPNGNILIQSGVCPRLNIEFDGKGIVVTGFKLLVHDEYELPAASDPVVPSTRSQV
jgi:hypothetical protein